MGGGPETLVRVEQLLAQLFAGARPCEPDGDILARAQPGQPDDLAGKVDDPDRLPHVQHVDLADLLGRAQRGGLQHELHRFPDGHEVASHLRMRHGQRIAALELLLEQRHDGAG